MTWASSRGLLKLVWLVLWAPMLAPFHCGAAPQNSFTPAQRYERQLEAGEIDEFRFDVSHSKVVHLRIVAKDPRALLPTVWLYGPSSKLIAHPNSNSTISLDCSNSSTRDCRITETGMHRLVITDYRGAGSGNYDIELLQLNGMNATSNFADIQSEVATARKGSVNMHAFSATPSSTMHFKITSIGKLLTVPKVWLYSPTGRILFESNQDRSTHFICRPNDRCRFTESGRHTLVVTHYGEEDGQYKLSVVNIPAVSEVAQAPTGPNTNTQNSYEPQGSGNSQTGVVHKNALQAYQARYPNGVFFTPKDEDAVKPQYLGGQCIAWAERLYDAGASKPISGYSYGKAANIPDVLQDKGYNIVKNPKAPKVGALIVWEGGKDGAGHVGVVTGIKQGPLKEGGSYEILVSEANYSDTGSVMTKDLAATWGLTVEEAKKEFVTTSYGIFKERIFDTGSLTRGDYKFKAYVYP